MIVERIDKSMMESTKVTKRKWNEVDLVWMKECFNEFWYWNVHEEICTIEDPDEIAERLTAILNVMLDSRWPVTSFQIKPNYAPYVNKTMRNLRRQKVNLWKSWKKTNNCETYKQMRMISNKLRIATRKARKRYIGRKMSDYRDSQELWKFAKDEAIGSRTTSHQSSSKME